MPAVSALPVITRGLAGDAITITCAALVGVRYADERSSSEDQRGTIAVCDGASKFLRPNAGDSLVLEMLPVDNRPAHLHLSAATGANPVSVGRRIRRYCRASGGSRWR